MIGWHRYRSCLATTFESRWELSKLKLIIILDIQPLSLNEHTWIIANLSIDSMVMKKLLYLPVFLNFASYFAFNKFCFKKGIFFYIPRIELHYGIFKKKLYLFFLLLSSFQPCAFWPPVAPFLLSYYLTTSLKTSHGRYLVS